MSGNTAALVGFSLVFVSLCRIIVSDKFDETFKSRMGQISRISATSIFDLGKEMNAGETEFSDKSKMKPVRKKNSRLFRNAVRSARKLDASLNRWEHRDKILPNEPDGCGSPVCIVWEARIKRFPSVCALFKYMYDNSMQKTVIKVQKGGCEDAIEGKRYDATWGQVSHQCQYCSKDNKYGCNQKVCIHIENAARTFDNVCDAMTWLGPKTNVVKIAVGLGDCKTLYSQCIYTDWFDLEDPCHKGDYEHYEAIKNMFIDTGNGIQNFCPKGFLEGSLQGVTLDGIAYPKNVTFQIYQSDLALQCLNDVQPARASPPYYWNNEEVRCRDFKIRFCCRLLYGTPAALFSENKVEALSLDSPELSGKTLFDNCEWRSFISSDYAVKRGDIETRAVHVRYRKTSACGSSTRSYAMIIDARLRSNDTPADETGEIITKYTPWFGFYCDHINNKPYGKRCSDYKVRYCCSKRVQEAAQWGDWTDYSKCSKSCGGGHQTRTRSCIKKRGNKQNCFGILQNKFSNQKRDCNIIPCPKQFHWTDWTAWTQCSASCGDGTRHRARGCYPSNNGGEDCPPKVDKRYKEVQECSTEKCPDPQWIKWQNWASCSKTCGTGMRTRERICIDINNYNKPSNNCPGPQEHEEACFEHHCPIDGGWSTWQNWGECNRACGEGGKRPKRRYCIHPFPENGGKDCSGNGVEYGPCEVLKPCPVHCLYSEWGVWSPCSVSCGNGPGVGTVERNRHIYQEAKYGGIKCGGIKREIKNCIHCNYTKNIQMEDIQNCIPYCPIDCVWEEWGQITGKCVICWGNQAGQFPKAVAKLRSRKKIRFVYIPPGNGGKECILSDGQNRQKDQFYEEAVLPCKVSEEIERPQKNEHFDTYKCKSTMVQGKPFFESWTMWSGCTAVCGRDGIQKRTRVCVGGSSKECESYTKFKSEETMPCPSVCAPPEWTMWENWSKCEVTCGIGQVARRRTCMADNRDKKFRKEAITCIGIQREQKKCDMGACGSKHDIDYEGEDSTGISGQWPSDYKLVEANHETVNLNSTKQDEDSLLVQNLEQQQPYDTKQHQTNNRIVKSEPDVVIKDSTNSIPPHLNLRPKDTMKPIESFRGLSSNGNKSIGVGERAEDFSYDAYESGETSRNTFDSKTDEYSSWVQE